MTDQIVFRKGIAIFVGVRNRGAGTCRGSDSGPRSPTRDSTSRHVTHHGLVDRCRLICDVFSNQATSVCWDDISATCRRHFQLRHEVVSFVRECSP